MADEGPIKELTTQGIANAYQLGTGYVSPNNDGKGGNGLSALGTGYLLGSIAIVLIAVFVISTIFKSLTNRSRGEEDVDVMINFGFAGVFFSLFVLFVGIFFIF